MLATGSTLDSKLQAKYSSATNSEGETSLSAKKKPFARKPASSQLSNTSEKRRRATEEQLQSMIIGIQQFQVEPSSSETPVKINFVKRKERQTENYNKEKEITFDNAYKLKKDASFSPLSSKKNLFDGVTYFSRNPSSKPQLETPNTSNISLDQSYASTPSSSRVVYEQYKNSGGPKDLPTYVNARKKIENTLVINPTLTASNCKIVRTNAVGAKNPPKVDKGKAENANMVECGYCKNNKEMTDIMCEKYRKLEEQFSIKNEKIKDLTNKLQSLKEEYTKLNQKYENKLEAIQLKEIQFFREKEEMMSRIDAYKSDIARLSQRLKYVDMQNGMLLRYKDEIQLMEKEYDIMMAQNDRLQSTISQMRRGEDKFKKNKHDSQYQLDRKPQNANIPYINGMKGLAQKYNGDDDLVSLSLSERSFDQF